MLPWITVHNMLLHEKEYFPLEILSENNSLPTASEQSRGFTEIHNQLRNGYLCWSLKAYYSQIHSDLIFAEHCFRNKCRFCSSNYCGWNTCIMLFFVRDCAESSTGFYKTLEFEMIWKPSYPPKFEHTYIRQWANPL